jgi:hypothetical protein
MTDNASTAAPLTRRDVEAKIVALAWKDDDFRRKFVADPKAQFEEKLGTKLPPSLNITAHQEDENSLYFVIPAKPKANLDELSDEELEKVAGGTDVVVSAIVTFSLGTAVAFSLGKAAGWK